jgi:hypothetical protein
LLNRDSSSLASENSENDLAKVIGRISKQTHSLLIKNGNNDVAETLQAIRFGRQIQTEFCGLESEFTFREAAAYKKKSCAHAIIIQ